MWNLCISLTFVFPVMGRINALRVETVSNTVLGRGGGPRAGAGGGVNSSDAFRGGLAVCLAQGLQGDWGMPEETWC